MLKRLAAHVHRWRLIRGQPKEYLDWRHRQMPNECAVCSYTTWMRLEKSIDLGPVQHECCEGNGRLDFEVRIARMQRTTDIATLGVGVPLVIASWVAGIGYALGGVMALAMLFGGRWLVRWATRTNGPIDRWLERRNHKRLKP